MESQGIANTQDRLERLSRRSVKTHSGGYSRFIRAMRLVLPLGAVGMIALLFGWNSMEQEQIVARQQTPQEQAQNQASSRRISRNELLNPKFESTDKKSQPYKITADRALQGEKNKDLIMLENPVGTLTMQDGVVVSVKSTTGAYRQDTERFFLEGGVELLHDSGYLLQSAEAHVDLRENYAWSEKNVNGSGPDIEIEAKGLRANGKTGQILFTGPVKLVLDGDLKGID
jgi:lipopolysaccharide export system protein LptC